MDGARIKQVLLNLVGNAVKFTPEGGRVWVRADSEDGVVRIEVGDTGPGIAAEDQERIFLEFQQAGSEAGKPQGTGLGLALARKFVEMHKGKIMGWKVKWEREAGFSSRCRSIGVISAQRRKGRQGRENFTGGKESQYPLRA